MRGLPPPIVIYRDWRHWQARARTTAEGLAECTAVRDPEIDSAQLLDEYHGMRYW